MNIIFKTWQIMGACLLVLMANKKLLIFPILGGFFSFLVIFFCISFEIFPAAYFGVYFCMIFFNAACIAAIEKAKKDSIVSIRSGIEGALANFFALLCWSLITATVGLLIRMLERLEPIGKFVSDLLGIVWGVATFFVVPIIVMEKTGAIKSIQEANNPSLSSWAPQLIGNVGFWLFAWLLLFPPILLIKAFDGSILTPTIGYPLLVYGLGIIAVISALGAIFQTALYHFYRHGKVPSWFDYSIWK
jgi:uncharacterized membrane protein